MPIPADLRQPGARVSYEDRANPRRVGHIVGPKLALRHSPADEWLVRWEDGEETFSDLAQHGWSLVASLPGSPFDGADIISAYTRAQAIEDGVLVDVSEMAAEAGFRYPVAMTRAAWADCVEWPAEGMAAYQDESGRLWDVLWLARTMGIARAKGPRAEFSVCRIPNEPTARQPRERLLIAVCGPGDTPEPVITIMLPGED